MLIFKTPIRIRGGIHAPEHKSATAGKPIATGFPLPKKLYIPLQQHVGQPADPVVRVGQKVWKGELLAHSQGLISAPVHAPSSGAVIDIIGYPAPHPSALPVRTVILETDGEERWLERPAPSDPFSLDPEEISQRVDAAGIVGLGGAVFPTAVKLNLGRRNKIHTLIINGGECEPYLTCDDRLMRERAAGIIDGVRLMLHGMETRRAIIAIEDNKPQAFAAMRQASAAFEEIEVTRTPTRYPMGWDRQLIRFITGREVPAGGRAADVGVIMHNVATAYAVHRAIRLGRPLIERIVTVSGGAVTRPMNVEVPIGTPISELLAFCALEEARMERLVMGGPMMGEALPHAELPVVKATNGILALTREELAAREEQPCIRCSRCVSACPAGLLPLEMAARIRTGRLDAALDYGLKDCIGCGTCSYVCPSNIPLVHHFKYASGELLARQRAQHKSEQTKRLMEERKRRLERLRQEKEAQTVRRDDEETRHETEEAAA